MSYNNSESSVNMNNDSDIEHMFEIESELKMKNLLKTALNFSLSILVNTLNEYCSDNESANDNSDDQNTIFLQHHAS